MTTLLLAILAVSLYGIGTLHQMLVYLRKIKSRAAISLLIGASALAGHSAVTINAMLTTQGVDFSLTNALSLTSCLVILTLLILSMRRPLQNTLMIAYPIAASCLISLLLVEHEMHRYSPEHTGIYAHILLSILAYSASSIAAAQAALILLQNHNLKRRNNAILFRNLPPLLTMEKLLFEIVRAAVMLLTLAIITGAIFIDDFFAQKLAHKSFFTLCALVVFITILVGRNRYGWRGTSVSLWTIGACAMLMLGYFGSKFVLEWVLQTPPGI